MYTTWWGISDPPHLRLSVGLGENIKEKKTKHHTHILGGADFRFISCMAKYRLYSVKKNNGRVKHINMYAHTNTLVFLEVHTDK